MKNLREVIIEKYQDQNGREFEIIDVDLDSNKTHNIYTIKYKGDKHNTIKRILKTKDPLNKIKDRTSSGEDYDLVAACLGMV